MDQQLFLKSLQIFQLVRNGWIDESSPHVLEGSIQFSNGGFVVFQVTSDTPLVKVSGCVNFGGSITVNASHLPTNISSITLMTFNCSIGRFDFVDIGSQSCSPSLQYFEKSLVLNLKDCQKENPIPLIWVLWLFIGLILFAIVVITIFFTVRFWRRRLEESDSKPMYWSCDHSTFAN